ncbi:XdhC family protein [Sulfobacillus harzensis]|uniref:XdhC family protein n=1 Tax=Sulfobacillus harzensis TaxID=2729629 RepID=A0A7Y0L6Q0_9FIRM|nr:XdhC family protein [Sulfobacillus harzensis]NMP24028.1 XdhC family protein [Sulfobacillus harzensis]
MSSIREARSLWDKALGWHREGHRVAWLTLVKVEGSAYRRPGAKMVMADHGHMQGTLSGGCLEGDLFGHAEKVMATGQASLHHYDLTEDEMWGLGIGCKGKVDIWIEPLNPDQPFWTTFGEALQHDQALVWGAELPEGGRFFGGAEGAWTVFSEDQPPFKAVELLQSPRTTGVTDGWWWDIMRPPSRLVVAGAGHDAEPVAQLAHQAGFDVIVLDPRGHVNNAKHFPDAVHWVKAASEVDPGALTGSFWLIMNHHQSRDEEALALAAQSQPKFVGVLGPKSRTQEMLAKTGVNPAGIPLHSPVGLDLGAESPREVAVSLVAELMAAKNGTSGGSLNGSERIHR